MNTSKPFFVMLVASQLLTALPAVADEPTIPVQKLEAAPQLDGSGEDWASVSATSIPLTYLSDKNQTLTVDLKTGVFGDEIFFYAEWEDGSEDILHKPFVWDEAKGKYVKGSQREDRFAMQFAIDGDYTTDWYSGKSFTADMWHWKSSRSNPAGITHDKSTVISNEPMRESYHKVLDNGTNVYIYRPTDADGTPYKTRRYFKKQEELMPKYEFLDPLPRGVDDIKAKGVWKDGKWHLEQSRKLNTGKTDDVVFLAGESLKGGIAVFNHDDNERHFVSETLLFDLNF